MNVLLVVVLFLSCYDVTYSGTQKGKALLGDTLRALCDILSRS